MRKLKWNTIPILSIILISFLLLVLFALVLTDSTKGLLDKSTIGILILTLLVYYSQMYINQVNNHYSLESSFRIKQLENLYLPLKTVSSDFDKFDYKELVKYSYLASAELDQCIDDLIEYLKSPDDFTANEKSKLFKKVEDALKTDIESLEKDITMYLKK